MGKLDNNFDDSKQFTDWCAWKEAQDNKIKEANKPLFVYINSLDSEDVKEDKNGLSTFSIRDTITTDLIAMQSLDSSLLQDVVLFKKLLKKRYFDKNSDFYNYFYYPTVLKKIIDIYKEDGNILDVKASKKDLDMLQKCIHMDKLEETLKLLKKGKENE